MNKFFLFAMTLFSLNSFSQRQGMHSNFMDGSKKIYSSIDKALLYPDSVEIIDLSGSNLNEFPADLYKFKNLKELYLGTISYGHSIDVNNLSALPDDLYRLRNLEVLDLGQNKIKRLPKSIGSLTKLKKLNLLGNPIRELPKEFGSLKNLEILNLNYTKLKHLPIEFGNLSSLKILTITGTKLKHFPKTITKLDSLEFIDISGSGTMNLIETIDFLSELPRLSKICLPTMKEFPENIVKLKSLEQLYIFEYQFDDLSKPFEIISRIKSLKVLYLQHYGEPYGEIVSIPAQIGLLTGLEELYLYFYNGMDLPKEIANLKELRQFRSSEHVKSGIGYLSKTCEVH